MNNNIRRQRVTASETGCKHVEEALRESEEKYRLISESTSDLSAIITFTLRPKYIYVSPSHKAVMGYQPQDLIGKSCFQFIHPADRKQLRPLLKEYVKAKIIRASTKGDSNIVERLEFRA